MSGNIFARLLAAAGEGPCQPLIVDVMFRVAEDTIYYPDVMMTCDEGDADEAPSRPAPRVREAEPA
jgi:hypothetical protein